MMRLSEKDMRVAFAWNERHGSNSELARDHSIESLVLPLAPSDPKWLQLCRGTVAGGLLPRWTDAGAICHL